MIGARSRVFDGGVTMRKFLLAAVIFGAATGAQAADMPDFLRGSLPAGPAPTVDWRGFYIGGQAAYGSITSNRNSTNINGGLESTFVAPPPLTYDWVGLGQGHGSGVGYGGFAGYNWQWDEVVIGVEGNYLHTGLSAFTTASGFTYGGTPLAVATTTTSNANINVTDFGSVRVRGGYAIGCFLPYVFVGGGVGSQTVVSNISATPGPELLFDPLSAKTKTNLVYGYSAGVGVDYLIIGGLFLRAEYEYQRVTSTIESNINSARLGLGYKF
jgi:outer membrane immunogenic protein